MKDNSLLISHAGLPIHTNEDEYYYPFEVNSQFFYLTGLERAKMILVLAKVDGKNSEILFIEEYDQTVERWTGRIPTKKEVETVCGIKDIRYISDFESSIDRFMTRSVVNNAYLDTFRNAYQDLPDYNLVKAKEFIEKYPDVKIYNLHTYIGPLRKVKDEEEIGYVRKAIDITKQGLCEILKTLRPQMMEYEIQATFEYKCKMLGTKKFAFPTIAGNGINGCMLHYETNDAILEDGNLVLLDLGAKYKNYCSDITRTYPVNGKFTERQRQYYELVLSANKAVAEAAGPGVYIKDLQELTKKILGEGLVKMGKISKPEEVFKYYMHGVSHSIGIDAHDVNIGSEPLKEGNIISNEPGLYIDEEKIGIRIEDDLLITKDGCEVLSKDIIKEIDEIENYMMQYR